MRMFVAIPEESNPYDKGIRTHAQGTHLSERIETIVSIQDAPNQQQQLDPKDLDAIKTALYSKLLSGTAFSFS